MTISWEPLSAQQIQDMLMAEQQYRQLLWCADPGRVATITVAPGSIPTAAAVADAPAGYEGRGGKSFDGVEPDELRDLSVQQATAAVTAQRKGRSLMAALEAVDRQWKSDGRPHQFHLPD